MFAHQMKKWTLLATILLTIAAGCSRRAGDGGNDGQTIREVEVTPIKTMDFMRRAQVQGTIEAEEYAMVPSRTGGILQEILVEDGATVTNGQILAHIDAEQWENTRVAREQDLHHAQSALLVAEAQAQQASVERNRAEREQNRFVALRADDAVSQQSAEQVETKWKAAKAAERVAKANVDVAKAQIRQAEAALAIAERDVRDTVIRAPLDGAISHRMHERGESIAPNHPVFRIDAVRNLKFSAFLPERVFPDIVKGETPLELEAAQRMLGTYSIHYRSPTVHERLRNFEIRARLDAPPDWVAPGMMAKATIILDQREGRGVPTDTVIKSGTETYVIVVEDDKAKRVNVKTGYSTDGMTEILEGLSEDMAYVIKTGHHAVEDGAPVHVTNEE